MVSGAPMILDVSDVRVDGPLATKWDMLLRIVGRFSMSLDGIPLYVENDFPVVEFGSRLIGWMDEGAAKEFVYSSLETEVEGLVRFSPCDLGRWRVSAAWEQRSAPRSVTTEELLEASEAYLDRLNSALPPSVDASSVLSRRA
jgi:hypothetical protein